MPIHHKVKRLIITQPQWSWSIASLLVVVIVIIGIKLIFFSHAGSTSTWISIETESGNLSPGASFTADSNASGGQFIQFGTAATPTPSPTPTPTSTPAPTPTPTVTPTLSPTPTPINWIPVNVLDGDLRYYYSGFWEPQLISASGATVTMSQHQPTVPQVSGSHYDNHSLMEMWVSSSGDPSTANTIELGWSIDPSTFGDFSPHLWASAWINGQWQGYNTDLVPIIPNTIKAGQTNIVPGQPVTVGTTGTYEINNIAGDWYVFYNGRNFGYFPGSLWGGGFTKASWVNVYGEVETENTTCIQMGDGTLGSQLGSAQFSNFELISPTLSAVMQPYATISSGYDYGSVLSNGLNIGGPGVCP